MLGNSARSSKVVTSVSGLKSSALARLSQYGEPVSGLKCHRTAACKYAGGSSIGSVRGKSIREKSVSLARDLSSGIPPLSAADGAACLRPPVDPRYLANDSRSAQGVTSCRMGNHGCHHACECASHFVNHRVTSGV